MFVNERVHVNTREGLASRAVSESVGAVDDCRLSGRALLWRVRDWAVVMTCVSPSCQCVTLPSPWKRIETADVSRNDSRSIRCALFLWISDLGQSVFSEASLDPKCAHFHLGWWSCIRPSEMVTDVHMIPWPMSLWCLSISIHLDHDEWCVRVTICDHLSEGCRSWSWCRLWPRSNLLHFRNDVSRPDGWCWCCISMLIVRWIMSWVPGRREPHVQDDRRCTSNESSTSIRTNVGKSSWASPISIDVTPTSIQSSIASFDTTNSLRMFLLAPVGWIISHSFQSSDRSMMIWCHISHHFSAIQTDCFRRVAHDPPHFVAAISPLSPYLPANHPHIQRTRDGSPLTRQIPAYSSASSSVCDPVAVVSIFFWSACSIAKGWDTLSIYPTFMNGLIVWWMILNFWIVMSGISFHSITSTCWHVFSPLSF